MREAAELRATQATVLQKKTREEDEHSSRVENNPGGDLLSHRVSPAVPWALEDLTSEFEMGSGVAPPVWPPEIFWCLEYETIRFRTLRGFRTSRIEFGRVKPALAHARVDAYQPSPVGLIQVVLVHRASTSTP